MNIDQIVTAVQRARKTRQWLNKYIRSFDVSFNEFELLYVLNLNKENTPSQISTITGHGNSTISRILSTLKDKQLICLDTNHIDRRNVSVELTARGEQLYKKMENILLSKIV